MKDKVFGFLQKIGRSFLLPIAVLPFAGLLMGVGFSLTGSNLVPEGSFLYKLLSVLGDSGDAVFLILPLLLCVAVSLGLAKQYKEVAAISAIFSYFVMNMANSSIVNNFMDVDSLKQTPGLLSDFLGFSNVMNTSVLGAIVLGAIISQLHNKFYKIKLPEMFAFFGGLNFVPIISTIAGIIFGISMTFIWPPIAEGITLLGSFVGSLGYVGTFLYGFIYRLLIPTGLHHAFYLPFWQTAIGGTETINGVLFSGSQNILMEQIRLGLPISAEVGRFYSGEFAMMMFGLPGAALALYHTAFKENRSKVKGLLVSAALASFLTGITEPLEFSFLFAAPLLYFVHAILTGLCFMVANFLGGGVANNFSAGALDFLIYGVMLGNERSRWIIVLILGVVTFFVYYFVFRFMIKKFNYKTPGRETNTDEIKLHTKKDYLNKKEDNKYQLIIEGLGGLNNIEDIDACATRLRLRLIDGDLIDETMLKESGSLGLVHKGNNVQVIYGPKVSTIRPELEAYIESMNKKN